MRKFATCLQRLLLLPAVLMLWTACGDDDYHYPPITMEFLTAHSGSDGRLETVLTDKGESYAVLNSVFAPNHAADSTMRIVANFTCETTEQKAAGALLYSASTTISPVPLPTSAFKEGVKTDPVSLVSIWMGLDYLNLVLEVKGTEATHTYHFIEEQVEDNAAGTHRTVSLRLYHDAADDPPYYTRRIYLSVPLRSYATDGIQTVTVHFSLRNEENKTETYSFEYLPEQSFTCL